MCSMQIESVLQIKNRSEPAKNRFSVALPPTNTQFVGGGYKKEAKKKDQNVSGR